MSILINDMEMPKDGQFISIAFGIYGNVYARLEPSFDDYHPLSEVPPHGRLIDADVLKRNIAANLPAAFQDFSAGLCFIVDMQRTVIEADRNGER